MDDTLGHNNPGLLAKRRGQRKMSRGARKKSQGIKHVAPLRGGHVLGGRRASRVAVELRGKRRAVAAAAS
eukprot:9058772-Alexandrium_andersonii.AAC.1